MSILQSNFAVGGRGRDILFGRDGDDFLDGRGGRDALFGLDGEDTLIGGRGRDLLLGGAGDDLLDGGRGRDALFGGDGNDEIDAGRGGDFVFGGSGQDFIATGAGRDFIAFAGDPFDGGDTSGADRQIIGNEDFIADFDFRRDVYLFDGDDFDVDGRVDFASLDANADDAFIAPGKNVIVLLNSDNDDNPETPFLAGTAATQIAELVETDGAGFFVYFNSNLQLNRLVYSENLNEATADLKIVSRQTDLLGQDAVDALARFQADNFAIVSDGDSILLTEDDDRPSWGSPDLAAYLEPESVDAFVDTGEALADDLAGLDLMADSMWA